MNDFTVVSFRDDIVLVPVFSSQNDEITLSKSGDDEVELVSSDHHVFDRLFRLISVAAALEILVPDFEALVL